MPPFPDFGSRDEWHTVLSFCWHGDLTPAERSFLHGIRDEEFLLCTPLTRLWEIADRLLARAEGGAA